MTRRFTRFLAVVAVSVLPASIAAQAEDDKSILENFLQDNLSAAGRTVEVTGFSGALSSLATLERLTVADDEGVWLTLEGAELDWTRSALLKGKLEIAALTAERIEIARPPVATGDGPSPATSDFVLPELPVSIRIGEISAAELVLGEPVLGEGVTFRLDGSGQLQGGAGNAAFTLERIDGKRGRFAVAAGYANDTRELTLNLDLDEGADGIVAGLTGLPGAAPLAFSLEGTGPIDAYVADLALSTDGAERIGGRVTLFRESPDAPLDFTANLAGDPTALLSPDVRAFFGDDIRLKVAGRQDEAGGFDLSELEIATEALQLSGQALIGPDGWPRRVKLDGVVATPGGGPVRLPAGGAPTWVDRIGLAFDLDAARGDDWRAEVTLDGLSRPDMQLAAARLAATGTLSPGAAGGLPSFGGHVDLTARGLSGAADSPAQALGPDLTGSFDLGRSSGETLRFRNLVLGGADYRLTGDVTFDTVVEKLDLVARGAIALAADDLARFARLAGQDLSGAARLQIEGNAALPGGPFDVEITGTGQDLGIGVPEVDRLFAGASTLTIAAARDEAGTRIDRFDIRAPGASASGTGWLAETGSQLALRLDMPNAALLSDGLDGPFSAEARALQRAAGWDLALEVSAPGGTALDFTGAAATTPSGMFSFSSIEGDLSARIDRLAAYADLAGMTLAGSARLDGNGTFDLGTGAFGLDGTGATTGLSLGLGAADRLIGGQARTQFTLRRDSGGTLFVDRLTLDTPELDFEATGSAPDGKPRVDLSARLRDLGLFVPGLSGAFSGAGSAALGDAGWQISLTGDGPGGTSIRATGVVAEDGARADLTLKGRAPLALANDFIAPRALSGMAVYDLTLSGPFAPASLSGTLRTEGARAALPTVGISLDPLTATVRLGGGQAVLDVGAGVSSGGRITVSGPVALAAPYSGSLAVQLLAVGLRDESLYDLTLDGNLNVAGPLAGGANITGGVQLGKVELRIPETGLGVDGSLDGLRHVGLPGDVRATQVRAGQTGSGAGGGGGGPVYGLGITIDAPSAVFIRGRGLDAELGGSFTIDGTTENVITTGGVTLIRGRLDILGNRLDLTEGSADLRGSLDPALNLLAETQVEDAAIRIAIEGLASDPTVTFSSSPDLPEDEILARLVFGRGIDQISAFQALKLASAVATLSGKGGSGTIGKLREGFGLDDLDVTTDADGELEVRAGTYISDNVYTDVTVGADGRAEVNLNLTLTPNVTARGSVSSDGATGIGVYFEKDY